MRKILLGLISILLLASAIYMAIYGVSIGGLHVSGIPAIKEENDKLEEKIKTAANLRDAEYPQNTLLVEAAYKKLVAEKEGYEQLLALGVDDEGQPLSKIQEYEIEKIWITLGNYATKQGVDLKMDITSNNSISKTYDLNFTVSGGYIQIIDFLYDIEQDKTLVFKIENFKMVPGGSGGTSTSKNEDSKEDSEDNSSTETSSDVALTATFSCKDIKLNISETNNSQENNENSDNTGNMETTNTTEQSNTTTEGTTNTQGTNTTNTNTTNTNTTNTNTINTNTKNTSTNTNTIQ